jgi:hypothetical protein
MKIGSPVIFSPDSRRVAYIAEKSDKECVVIDGVAGKEYSSVQIDFCLFSPDSKRVAYKAVIYGENLTAGNKWFVVIDGEEGDPYQTADKVTFSPDSKHIAYIADGGVYLDRKQMKRPGGVVFEYNGLLFSPDSEHLVYVIGQNGKQSVVVDGVPGKQYDEISKINYSPDSKHLAYAAQTGDKWFIVFDGVPGKPYDRIGNMVFSPDSQHLAYVAREGLGRSDARGFVVLDGIEGEQYKLQYITNLALNLVFSPDSNHLAYTFEWEPILSTKLRNTGFLIVDGKEKEETGGTVHRLLFSPDSQRLSYIESNLPWSLERKFWISVGGEKGEKYEYIDDFIFSPDGKHIVYIVTYGTKMFVVVDKTEGNEYDLLGSASATASADDVNIHRIVFDSADRFHYLVIKGDSVYIVEETFK